MPRMSVVQSVSLKTYKTVRMLTLLVGIIEKIIWAISWIERPSIHRYRQDRVHTPAHLVATRRLLASPHAFDRLFSSETSALPPANPHPHPTSVNHDASLSSVCCHRDCVQIPVVDAVWYWHLGILMPYPASTSLATGD